jgi:hypothetical protein
MWDRIVGIANALGVERPCFVLGLGKITHCSVPESPPGFYLAVRLGVMAAGRSASGACYIGNGRHKFAEEFRRVVGVKDIGGAAAKVEFIEERVAAWRSGRGIRITVFAKLSIRAKASVSPVFARP